MKIIQIPIDQTEMRFITSRSILQKVHEHKDVKDECFDNATLQKVFQIKLIFPSVSFEKDWRLDPSSIASILKEVTTLCEAGWKIEVEVIHKDVFFEKFEKLDVKVVRRDTETIIFKIEKQGRKEFQFSPISRSRQFTASNGYSLVSSSSPEFAEGGSKVVFVRGSQPSYDDCPITCTINEWEQIKIAIDEYNKLLLEVM